MANENARDEESQTQESGSGNESNGSGSSSLISKSNLIPAAATALAAAGAGLAVTKGPDLMRKLSGNAEGQAEELGRKGVEGAQEALSQGKAGMVGKAASKLMGGGGGGGGTGKGGKTRRLPIQRWTDVAVPVEEAYEKWTNFEEFPKFMHRVLEVKQEEEGKLHWQEKIWFSTREWDGEIVEQRKNDRIAWKSVAGTQHSGVISFHRLDKSLTRVLVTVDFVPTGMIEKMASGMRFVKRAVQADLARFKAYAELGEVDGLEYKSTPAEMEQHQGEQQEESSESEDEGSEEQEDDSERESRQEERESRRKERRESVSSS